ncbi:Gfo/Idh/MocA family protein [Ruania halotolerans]|uniref:Gfo/Idh/MocA family protein n=1 Tax=Ruania halotolerans TaxID=2897773 RepID=UPI001E62DB06|nr:Gfo/Idh/MocA family oxidoreductase [Ruania halotolerans]UFU05526.1 Gfo/Idh/MocA family oxidoreductase [Ruania halotolerans]
MPSPLRIAVLSAWHVHAEEYGHAAINHPETELVAVWDDDTERGRALAERLGVEFTPDLSALLARDDLDGVTVTTATSDHDAVLAATIAAGKHIFTEKLLSPTVQGCDDLISSAASAGLALTVSLPRLSHGYTLAVREILASGRLGRITYARVRLAHDGSTRDWLPARFYDPVAALGGAFSDLAAHPVYLTQLILGAEIVTVRSTYTDMTGRGVEDNAVVTVSTTDGAIGVIETGFVTPASPFTIEVLGTAGSLLYGFENHADGSAVLRLGTTNGWEEIDIPADGPAPFDMWVEAIRSGEPTAENLHRARALTALVVAANNDAHT